ncbi:Methanogenesis regulatory histidine kinase FilI [uncultured archaeon]|nr:Methanogenesis regulatory histidine kinase FilI [uncultured archaeon]
MTEVRILVVEDERIVAEDLRMRLQKMGYAVPSTVSSGDEAIRELEKNGADLVIMDIVIKGEMDGIETADIIRSRFDVPVVYLTAYADEEMLNRARITEPFGYIVKPFDERELHITIEMALYKSKMENKLKEAKERFSATLNSIGDGIIAMDSGRRILFMNPAARSMTGRDLDDARGKSLEEVYNIITNGNGESTLVTGNGKTIFVEHAYTPLKDSKGKLNGLVLVFRDISGRKRAEELRLENMRLNYANKIKSEFIANTSHELVTPLNFIIGFSELLVRNTVGELNETQERYAENINKSGRHLLMLINDILDLSRIEAGKIGLFFENISVSGTINDTISLIKEKAGKHNIHLITDIDPGLEIEADEQRLKQVLLNLLDNAVKFSKKEGGTVTIKAGKEGDMALFSVSDTGIGIREEDMKKLFNQFEQLDSGISKKYGGTGLGLAITKKLVELHGGKITVESRYGEGSTFIFVIPVTQKR